MEETCSVGSPELLILGDEGGEASALLPALRGEAMWGPPPSDLPSASHGGSRPPDCSSSFYGDAPTASGALSYSGWGGPASQSMLVPSPPPSQGAPLSQSFLAPPPSMFQGGPSLPNAPPSAPPRDATPSEVGKGIFLCERIVLEYSGDCQLPAEVRLALKHPHGYRVKGPQRGPPSRQTSDLSEASERRGSVSTRGIGEEADGRGAPRGTSGGPCKCSDCERCRAVAEARSILSPFGLHLSLGLPPADRSLQRGGSAGRRKDLGARKEAEKQWSPSSLALACLPAETNSSAPVLGPPAGASGASGTCVCALLEPDKGAPNGGGPRTITGQLVCEALTPKERAAVEAAAAIKRALTYFLLEAPPPAAAAVVRVGAPRVPGQKDTEGPLQQHAKAGPLAAVKLLTEQQQQQQARQRSDGSRYLNGSSSSSSSAGVMKSSSCSRSNPAVSREARPTDGQGALMDGLLDAIMQLHDVPSSQHQAAVCTNHFSALLSNQRAVVTYASKAFQAFLLQHEEALKSEFPRGATAARRQQQEARRRFALSAAGAPQGPSNKGPSAKGEEGNAINEALQLGPTFSLHCFIFEGQHRARSLLKMLKAFVSLHAQAGGPKAAAPGGPSTFNSFVAAATAHTSAEAQALQKMGRRAFGAPLQVFLIVSNFRVRGARVTDARVLFTDLAVSHNGGLATSTKRLRIKGLLLPQSQKEILLAVSALEASGALTSCSLYWGFSRQPHAGGPFYNQGLSVCFPGEKVWRQFHLYGGALARQRPQPFGALRALVPDVMWGMAAEKQKETQKLEEQEAAARAAAATAAAAAAAAAAAPGRSPEQPLLAITDEATGNGAEGPVDAALFYCWLTELKGQLPLPLRRRCVTERRALQALAAAKHQLPGAEEGRGAPEAPKEGPPASSEEAVVPVSAMRLCVPFMSPRFASGRKEQMQLLQQAPIETFVSSVYFRFIAKHGAPPPFDADLGPPLRPSWLRCLGALRSKTKGEPPHPQGGPAAATEAEGGPSRGPEASAEAVICLIGGEAENDSVFGREGLMASLAAVLRLALEEAAFIKRSSFSLTVPNALAAARRCCDKKQQGGPLNQDGGAPVESRPPPLNIYAVVLADPEDSPKAADDMRALLEMQRNAAREAVKVHFLSAAWAYRCLHEGSLNPPASLPHHLQVEGLPPCCEGRGPHEEGSSNSIVPLGGPSIPERLKLLPRHERLLKEPWGLPLFGWCLVTTERDMLALSLSREELETVWGVSLVIVSSLSPQSVLRGLLSLFASLGVHTAAAPADMRQLPLCAAVLVADSTIPEAAAEALGVPAGAPQSPPVQSPLRGPLSPKKPHQVIANGPFTPRKSSNKSLGLSPRCASSGAENRASAASEGPPTVTTPLRSSRRAASTSLSPWGSQAAKATAMKLSASPTPLAKGGPRTPLRSAGRPSPQVSVRAGGGPSSPLRGPSSPLRTLLRPSLRMGAPNSCRANLSLYQRGSWGGSWGARSEAPRFCVRSGTYKLMLGRLRVFLPGLDGLPLVRGFWLQECLRMRRLLPLRHFMAVLKQEEKEQPDQQQQQEGGGVGFPFSEGQSPMGLSIQRKHPREEGEQQTPKRRRCNGASSPVKGPEASTTSEGPSPVEGTPKRPSVAPGKGRGIPSPSRLPQAPTTAEATATASPATALTPLTQKTAVNDIPHDAPSPSLIPKPRKSSAADRNVQPPCEAPEVDAQAQKPTRRGRTSLKEGEQQQQQRQQKGRTARNAVKKGAAAARSTRNWTK